MQESEDYRKQIEEIKKSANQENLSGSQEVLQKSIALLEKLEDERSSLWTLIDEMKKSDLQNYAEFILQETQNKIAEARASTVRKRSWRNEKN